MIERISREEARQLLTNPPKKKRAKYKNTRFSTGGQHWHSIREYERWLLLTDKYKAGEISELRRQVPFPLHVRTSRIATYVADFVYKENGKLVVEDVKARRRPGQKRSVTETAEFRRTRKHILAEYGISITVIA